MVEENHAASNHIRVGGVPVRQAVQCVVRDLGALSVHEADGKSIHKTSRVVVNQSVIRGSECDV